MEGLFKNTNYKNIDFVIRSNSLNSSAWQIKTTSVASKTHNPQLQTLFILRPGRTYNNNIGGLLTAIDYDNGFAHTQAINNSSDIATTSVTSISIATPSASIYSSFDKWSSTATIFLANSHPNNYWALLALILVVGTAAGNILVCLAIAWERRLQNVTNYFLMSLAITDLMVAVLVMPLGILTLVKGYFPLGSEYCLTWICLDVLFCTASIMHLCTISVDRYLSLRYPMRFGRNKTRRRVTLKIIFVWLLSIAMSLPLSLMYSKDHASVLVNGTCQIPDPVYKLVGSIVCFYIPLTVMLLTYCLTVRLLAKQRENLGGVSTPGWASGWLGQAAAPERRCTWRRLLKSGHSSSPHAAHAHSANSTDTELSTIDNHELWLPESSVPESKNVTMTALQQFGAEMLKLSRGLESVASSSTCSPTRSELSSSQLNSSLHIPLQRYSSLQTHASPNQKKQSQQSRTSFEQQDSHACSQFNHLQLQSKKLNETCITDQEKVRETTCMSFGTTTRTFLPAISLSNDLKTRKQCKSPVSGSYTCILRKKRRASMEVHVPPPNTPTSPFLSKRSRFFSLSEDILFTYENTPFNDMMSSRTKGFQSETWHSDLDMNNTYIIDHKSCSAVESDSETLEFPLVCTCPYFGNGSLQKYLKPSEIKIVPAPFKLTTTSPIDIPITSTGDENSIILRNTTSSRLSPNAASIMDNAHSASLLTVHSSNDGCYLSAPFTPKRKLSISKTASVVTWDSSRHRRRGSSIGGAHTTLLLTPTKTGFLASSSSTAPLRRSATLRNHKNTNSNSGEMTFSSSLIAKSKSPHSSPCLFQRNQTVRSHHSRNSSIISRNSSRHGRIIRLEQKATKVLGVVFFTFVILWSPFFVLNLLPSVCGNCEDNIAHWIFDVVTWLGYASSMVNPVFYTIFNKVFRQAFKKVLLCRYTSRSAWPPQR